MTDLINTDDHTTEHKVTAEEVENNFPARFKIWESASPCMSRRCPKCEEKADQYYRSIGQYLAEARGPAMMSWL